MTKQRSVYSGVAICVWGGGGGVCVSVGGNGQPLFEPIKFNPVQGQVFLFCFMFVSLFLQCALPLYLKGWLRSVFYTTGVHM